MRKPGNISLSEQMTQHIPAPSWTSKVSKVSDKVGFYPRFGHGWVLTAVRLELKAAKNMRSKSTLAWERNGGIALSY